MPAKPKTASQHAAAREHHETQAEVYLASADEERALTDRSRFATIASAHLAAARYFADRAAAKGDKT